MENGKISRPAENRTAYLRTSSRRLVAMYTHSDIPALNICGAICKTLFTDLYNFCQYLGCDLSQQLCLLSQIACNNTSGMMYNGLQLRLRKKKVLQHLGRGTGVIYMTIKLCYCHKQFFITPQVWIIYVLQLRILIQRAWSIILCSAFVRINLYQRLG
jgi:hypothetical protein